ncbi:hypothetical protein [Paraflavitalea speifideaquila]|uniref:hypothetical protein n=1 Tax=Paraflavitalea speifideaquila TaxID=3076558 RepID=UPI0028EA5C9C|nr:hypothetical protein [Paraflavitalea speifideiaquila]
MVTVISSHLIGNQHYYIVHLLVNENQRSSKGGQGDGDRNRKMGQFMVNELKLDKDQEAVYWKLRDTMISRQKPLMDSIRNTKKEILRPLKGTRTTRLPLAGKS